MIIDFTLVIEIIVAIAAVATPILMGAQVILYLRQMQPNFYCFCRRSNGDKYPFVTLVISAGPKVAHITKIEIPGVKIAKADETFTDGFIDQSEPSQSDWSDSITGDFIVCPPELSYSTGVSHELVDLSNRKIKISMSSSLFRKSLPIIDK